MSLFPSRLFLWLLVVSILWGCRDTADKGNDTSTPSEKADITEIARQWADSIYRRMTPEERLAQMLIPAIYSNTDAATLERMRWYAEDIGTGGILLLKGTAESAAELADSISAIRSRKPHSPGLFVAMDAETGLGMRFSDAPLFPWNSKIDKAADDQTFYDYGREVGREARIAGINMILGPVVDVNRRETPGSGVMRSRSLGSDQIRVSDLSLAYARGLESQGVASVVKHFPGHGATTTDSHKILPRLSESKDELYTVDLLPFRTVVQNGLSCIMVGHIWAEALDSVRRPASFSPVMIEGLLRNEMGFKGLVLVDAVGMGGAKGYTGADAIIAGADMIIAPPDTESELMRLAEALDDGRLSGRRVEESCKRILFYKYLFGIHDGTREPASNGASNIKERLHEEAPDIISRLKGVSR